MTSPNALDQRARRAAKRIGLVAQKSRRGAGTVDSWGGYQLIDSHHNLVVDGSRFDLSAEEVIKICERDSWQQGWRHRGEGRREGAAVKTRHPNPEVIEAALEAVRERAVALTLDPDLNPNASSLSVIFRLLQAVVELIDAQSPSHDATLAKTREQLEATLAAFEPIESMASSH